MANLNLTPKEDIKAAETAAQTAEAQRTPTLSERIHFTTEQQKYYEALEARGVAGAPIRTPKEQLMSFDKLKDANPDTHYRWGNAQNSAKMEGRIAEGYEVVPEGEGGRRLGNEMVLMRIPRAEYERRVARDRKLTEDRLSTYKSDMQAAAESVARQMRDRYGVNVKINDILVDR